MARSWAGGVAVAHPLDEINHHTAHGIVVVRSIVLKNSHDAIFCEAHHITNGTGQES